MRLTVEVPGQSEQAAWQEAALQACPHSLARLVLLRRLCCSATASAAGGATPAGCARRAVAAVVAVVATIAVAVPGAVVAVAALLVAHAIRGSVAVAGTVVAAAAPAVESIALAAAYLPLKLLWHPRVAACNTTVCHNCICFHI